MPMETAMAGAAPMGMAMPSPEPVPSSEPFEPMNTAETHTARENELQSPLDNAQAIFSANVNTASWTYLRSKIARHQTIDTSFVRIEEIINSYQYDLPAPKDDELFSISAESGVCPWDKEKELLFLGFKGKKAVIRDINFTSVCDKAGFAYGEDNRYQSGGYRLLNLAASNLLGVFQADCVETDFEGIRIRKMSAFGLRQESSGQINKHTVIRRADIRE